MFKILRIVFTLLSATCVLPVVFLGVFVNLGWAVICAGVALLFFVLAAYFKRLQEKQEQKLIPKGDFFSPLKAKNEEKDVTQNEDNL